MSILQEVCQRLVNLSSQLHALQVRLQRAARLTILLSSHLTSWPCPQAAVIRQDSILELLLRTGSSSTGPHLSCSVSKDSGINTGGEVVLLQKQVQLLQDEVTRLRLRGEEPASEKAEPGSKKLTNGETGDVTKGKKVRNMSTKQDFLKTSRSSHSRLKRICLNPQPNTWCCCGDNLGNNSSPLEGQSRRSDMEASNHWLTVIEQSPSSCPRKRETSISTLILL